MTETIRLYHPTGILNGKVKLPASKSLSNRVLIIKALSHNLSEMSNLSEARDTQILLKLLKSNDYELNAEDAGTVFRFMTAYLSIQQESRLLTGSERMLERPIGPLVAALRAIGADIDYIKMVGFPPLKFNAFHGQTGKCVKIDANVSSQFISALMLIGPLLPYGLDIELVGDVVSKPYINMTASLMRNFGAEIKLSETSIEIKPKTYNNSCYQIEPDWSASSYFYSLMALSRGGEIFMEGLSQESLQGDRSVVEIYEKHFGIKTDFTDAGAVLSKSDAVGFDINISFINTPDLAQTFIVTAAACRKKMNIFGLETLKFKETDRIAALQTELNKLKVSLRPTRYNAYFLDALDFDLNHDLIVDTHGDHRMAMSFSPLGLLKPVKIKSPKVVEKSFPGFWRELQNLGFVVE